MHSAGRRRVGRRMEDVLDLYAEEPDPKRPVVVSTRARPSSSARCASRSRPRPASSNVTTASISAMERPTCSSSSTCIDRGARSRSRSGERQKTTPNACASSSMSIIPMPSHPGGRRADRRTSRRPVPGFPPAEARRILRRLESTTPQSTQVVTWSNRNRSAAQPMPRPTHRHEGAAPPNRCLGTQRNAPAPAQGAHRQARAKGAPPSRAGFCYGHHSGVEDPAPWLGTSAHNAATG